MNLDGIWLGAIVVTDVTASASFSGVLGVDESFFIDLAGHPEDFLRAGVDTTAATLTLVLCYHGTGQSRLLGL